MQFGERSQGHLANHLNSILEHVSNFDNANRKPKEPVNKGKVVQGKKIQNIDFDSLMFDDPFSSSETTVKSDPFSTNSLPVTKPEEKKVIVKETKVA